MGNLCLIEELLVGLNDCLRVPPLLQIQGPFLFQHRLLQLLYLNCGIGLVYELVAKVSIDVLVFTVQRLVASVGVHLISL